MQKGKKKAQLIEGPVIGTVIRLTGPMLVGILTMVMFNLIDTYFVGQLGTKQLAAMSFTFPVILMVSSLAMGLGVGTSAIISRTIGGGDTQQVRRLTTDALILSVMLVAAFSFVGLLTIEPVFNLLGATPDVMDYIREYMVVWYFGMSFLVIPMIGNNAIRATGDTKTPAMIMIFAVTINMIFDPLLIFGYGPFPALGIQGAAIATVISRASTLIASLYVLHYREHMLTFNVPSFSELLNSWKQVLYIGLPAAGTQMLIPISTGIITGMVATYGAEAVAAFGVASRIEMFGLALVMALSSTITPFVGQNWGAGKTERVQQAVRFAQIFSVIWGVFLAVLLILFNQPISGVFNDDPLVMSNLQTYLWLVPISYGLFGVLQVSNSALNALNRPLDSAGLSILRLIVLYIPLAIIGSQLFDLGGIFAGAMLSNIGAGVFAWYWLRRYLTYDSKPKREELVFTGIAPAGD